VIFTYFAPGSPAPGLSNTEHAAAHARQTRPTSTHDLQLVELFDWITTHAGGERKGDSGYIVAGDCRRSRRANATGPAGFALIDYDDRPEGPDWDALDAYQGFAWTTAAGAPHWRVVIPFTVPIAHGSLVCPFPGGHIRNRSQPAFLPTGDAVEWRVLGGAQTLDGSMLHKPKPERKAREVGATQLPEKDEQIAGDLAGVWKHGCDGDQAFGALGGWLRARGVSDDRIEGIATRLADLTESTHPDPADRALQDDCPLGRPKLQERLGIDSDEGAVLLVLDDVEDALRDSVPGFTAVISEPLSITNGQPGKRGMLQLVDAGTLAQPLGEIPWLVEGLDFAPGRPMIVAGSAGSGKTYALQEMALRVAGAPGDVWGHFPVARSGPVIHIDVDQGHYATAMRYQRLARGMGADLATLALDCAFFDFALSKKDGINPDAAKRLRDVCQGRALCIIDSLRGVAPGLDEQDSAFGEVLQTLSEISGVTGCAFVVVAHSGHEQDRARGTSAIQDRGGSIFQLTKVDVEGSEGHVQWEQKKRSEYGQGAFIKFRTIMNREPDGLDLQTSIRVDTDTPKKNDPKLALRESILSELSKHAAAGLSATQLFEGAAVRKEDRLTVLRSLVESGAVTKERAGRGWMYHPGSRIPIST